MRFETERLILRPWKEEDAEDCYRYAKDPGVGPAAGWPVHTDPENSRLIIKSGLMIPETYAIESKETGEVIGSISLKLNGMTDMSDRDDECELGFWLGRPFWGRGLMPEAAKAILKHAFTDLGMRKVWCGYYEGNLKSKRTQEKMGFHYHHTTENTDVPLLGEKRTAHVNLLTLEEWQSLESL